jgi:hypothetical protein
VRLLAQINIRLLQGSRLSLLILFPALFVEKVRMTAKLKRDSQISDCEII